MMCLMTQMRVGFSLVRHALTFRLSFGWLEKKHFEFTECGSDKQCRDSPDALIELRVSGYIIRVSGYIIRRES